MRHPGGRDTMMFKTCQRFSLVVRLAVLGSFPACAHSPPGERSLGGEPATVATPARQTECVLLFELGVGQIRRAPSGGCASRVPPMSTFKVAHAALHAGVLNGPDELIKYDGLPWEFESFRRDHTLATAMRFSVLWYFQRVAERLGSAREAAYLKRFAYGNADSSSYLTSFWLYESLRISPDEQQTFMIKLYEGSLPI